MPRYERPSKELLAKCADVSQLAYKDEPLSPWMKRCQRWEDNDAIIFVEENDPEDAQEKKRVFFGFRGTRLSNGQDLIDDINGVHTLLSDCTDDGGSFHKGFKNRSRRCWDQIFDKFTDIWKKEDFDNYKIILCGHSLGGAAAAVTYIRLKTKRSKARRECVEPNDQDPAEIMSILLSSSEDGNSDIPLDDEKKNILKILPDDFCCVTFGTPIFGNGRNKTYCDDNKISSGIVNVVHEKDPIPGIFLIFPFQFLTIADSPIGNYEILLESSGESEFLPAFRPQGISSTTIKDKLRACNLINISFHKIQLYINLLAISTGGDVPLPKASLCTEEQQWKTILKRTNDHMTSEGKPYSVHRFIGEGSYGWVMEGKDTSTSASVAIKKIKNDVVGPQMTFELESNDGKEIKGSKEINSLKSLNHDNVVKLMDYFQVDQEKVYLVLEYCPLGSLDNFISKTMKRALDENEVRRLLKHTLSGLAAVHEKDIIHRDVKPGNILVSNSTDNPVYKLTDFGSATEYGGRTTSLTVHGTKYYMSPEVYQAWSQKKLKVRINPQTDVFSMGAVVLYCKRLSEPWTLHELQSLTDDSAKQRVNEILRESSECSENLVDMVTEMVYSERHNRPKAENLLNHAFMLGDRTKVT